MMRRRTIALALAFSGGLVSLHAQEEVRSLHVLASGASLPATKVGTECTGGIRYDDGTFENGYGYNSSVTAGTYAMKFDLPGVENRLDAVCICWQSLSGQSHDHGLRIWAADGPGGTPGTLLATLPATSVTGITVQGRFTRYEIPGGLQVPTNQIYIAPTWSPLFFPDRFLCADENGATPRPGFGGVFSTTLNPEIKPVASIVSGFPNYRALGIRAEVTPIADPDPPAGPWLTTSQLPGFRFKSQITAGASTRPATQVIDCVPETLCLAGAIPDRTEVFVRIIGPRSNGFLWPQVVRFTVSQVEVWIEQTATGEIQYYKLPAVATDSTDLPGLVDREGFTP